MRTTVPPGLHQSSRAGGAEIGPEQMVKTFSMDLRQRGGCPRHVCKRPVGPELRNFRR